MAESTKKAPQERRRSLAAEPFEELDAEAKGQGDTLKKAALAAAVTAGAGALAGAAKALLDKRKAHESPPSSDAAENGSDESDDAQADEPEARAPEPAVAEELDDEDAEEGDDESGDELDEPDETEEDDDDGDLEDAAEARSDASEVVSRAREQFEHLLGREPESISRIERTNGHWSVTLEAVELRRIPDSTDVLASYELVLDDDGNVARMARKGRYVRSQGDAA
jgi:hypothetical protein